MRRKTRPYRPDRPAVAELAAGAIVLLAPRSEILLLHHAEEDRWCFPKGHVEKGESVRAAALREVIEETGIRSIRLGREIAHVGYRFYDPARGLNVFKTTVYLIARTPQSAVRPERLFDAFRWLPPSRAALLLEYATDRAVARGVASGLRARRSGPRPRDGKSHS